MSLVTSLLQAIIRIDGDALVLHVGDKPYVVSPSGPIDLASRGLTLDAISGILRQLLPKDSNRALQELGSVQHHVPPLSEYPGENFTIVAARDGDDVWAEIRRRRAPGVRAVLDEPGSSSKGGADMPPPVYDDGLEIPNVSQLWPDQKPETRVLLPTPEHEAPPASAVPLPQPPVVPVAPAPPPAPVFGGPDRAVPESAPAAPAPPPPPAIPAVVVPLARSPIRPEGPPPLSESPASSLDRLLRLAAARGASSLYLSSGAMPAVRVDGELQALEGTPPFTANDVDSLLLALRPERTAEALYRGDVTEWICDVAEIGRVRCVTFRDHRGPGGVLRIMPARAVTADEIGLSREVQALADESSGLILVAGPRDSGKRTLISALVDLINRVRHHHVITIEREINVVHEQRTSFISQREVRGRDDEHLAAARAALREDPDVLVLEDLRSTALIELALDAAAAGRLVIGGYTAASASSAVARIIELFSFEHRRHVQLSLAQNLRGVVAQVLLRKVGGGRVAARELLLNSPGVASVIAEGRTSQLPVVIEGGRRHGMMPLNDALVGYVQSGAVDPGDAYRSAADREGFLALLERQGLDTSFAERLA
jgi:twitching motility protein PilT